MLQILVSAKVSPIVMNWVNNENPQGKPMKGAHLVLSIAFMVLVCSCSTVYGYSSVLSAFMAGIFFPSDGRVSKWVTLNHHLFQKFKLVGSIQNWSVLGFLKVIKVGPM